MCGGGRGKKAETNNVYDAAAFLFPQAGGGDIQQLF